jgi:predicted esterase
MGVLNASFEAEFFYRDELESNMGLKIETPQVSQGVEIVCSFHGILSSKVDFQGFTQGAVEVHSCSRQQRPIIMDCVVQQPGGVEADSQSHGDVPPVVLLGTNSLLMNTTRSKILIPSFSRFS